MEKTNYGETNDVIDRITTLPVAVRAHIFSFLSTKEAVGTCVLVLDINLEEFMGHTYEEREAKFEQFVQGVLQNREPSNLEKFKLVWYTKHCAPFNSVHLPFLKKLRLIRVIVNDDFVDKNFFGCPILEKLLLHDCILNVNKIVVWNSP